MDILFAQGHLPPKGIGELTFSDGSDEPITDRLEAVQGQQDANQLLTSLWDREKSALGKNLANRAGSGSSLCLLSLWKSWTEAAVWMAAWSQFWDVNPDLFSLKIARDLGDLAGAFLILTALTVFVAKSSKQWWRTQPGHRGVIFVILVVFSSLTLSSTPQVICDLAYLNARNPKIN
jgi:hypothetical protein